MRIVEQQMWVRLTTLPESQAAVEAELAQVGVPWTWWHATQRWPGGERQVLEVELLLPRPGKAAWTLHDRLTAAGIWVVGRMEAASMLG